MKTYLVLSAVEHGVKDNGSKRYEAGETIDLDDDHAKSLLACGAIAPQSPDSDNQADAEAKANAEQESAAKAEAAAKAKADAEAKAKAEQEAAAKADAEAKAKANKPAAKTGKKS